MTENKPDYVLGSSDHEIARLDAQSASIEAATRLGIPPMGLSDAGYYGHIFWDSDTWMFPLPVRERTYTSCSFRSVNATHRPSAFQT